LTTHGWKYESDGYQLLRKRSVGYVNIADVGFGVSQTLPVLVALLAADRDQIVFVEQPELQPSS